MFAGDLFRMYSRYAERQGWRVEIVSASESEVGGFKEMIAKIIGYGAYSILVLVPIGFYLLIIPED